MNTIIKRTWNQNRMTNIEDLRGMAFQAEDGGHTFEISGINDANEAVSLSGTVAGVFMRPDGTDVALTGTASDGVVSVTLSDACYAVDGRFGLYIFVIYDSKKTCVYACIGTIAQTSYGTVAGDTPQNVVDLINAINAAIASIPADYTALIAAIAPTYSDQSVYPAGAYRWYNGVLYKSKVAITTAESWTAAHWTSAVLGDDVADLKSALDEITEYSEDYKSLTPVKTVLGKYVYNYTATNKLREASDASMAYKVFAVFPGKYKIYGFGYDRYQFYMGVIGDTPEVMDGDIAISNFIQNIECGGSAYPADFTYHTVVIDLNVTGYLFVNYKNAQADGTCGVPILVPITDPAIKSAVKNISASSGLHGVIKDGNDYYHFSPMDGKFLLRKFKQMGGNNLFQWAGIYIGTFDENGISISDTIINYDTDIIGPIEIFNTDFWPGKYGEWAGGNHTKTISGTAYPTATQDSLKLLVNGTVITEDGVYYGDAKFVAINSVYFPQSITGADLSSATKALIETREYNLDNQLAVRVRLNFVETTRCSVYFGMQAVIVPYNNILLADNEYYGALPNASNINFSKKEHEVIMIANDGMRLIASLKDVGLGTFSHNDGSSGYVTLPAASTTKKLYYRLISGASSQGFGNGDVLMWEGRYTVDTI